MKIIKESFTFFIVLSFLLLLTSCGSNNPISSGSSTNLKPVGSSSTISQYQGTTHRDIITSGAIDLLLVSGNLTSKQKALLNLYGAKIEKGSIDEDDPITRTVNHFWDPVHNKPLTDGGDVEALGLGGQKAIDWAKSGDGYMYASAKSNLLAALTTFDSNNSANMSQMGTAMENLGHVLHIFQDMTSVPHTRNDNHAGQLGFGYSGYENFVVAGQYFHPPVSIIIPVNNDGELWQKFTGLAQFTNANFYSEDSIPIAGQAAWRTFTYPALPSGTGYLAGSVVNPLVIAIKDSKTKKIQYTIQDSSNTVHKAYADILVPKAISYSAGVIQYFIQHCVDVTVSNPNLSTGENVTFSVDKVFLGSGNYSYEWHFGDNATGTGAAPGHVYITAGTFTAWVQVKDNANGDIVGVGSLTLNVTESQSDPPNRPTNCPPGWTCQ